MTPVLAAHLPGIEPSTDGLAEQIYPTGELDPIVVLRRAAEPPMAS